MTTQSKPHAARELKRRRTARPLWQLSALALLASVGIAASVVLLGTGNPSATAFSAEAMDAAPLHATAGIAPEESETSVPDASVALAHRGADGASAPAPTF